MVSLLMRLLRKVSSLLIMYAAMSQTQGFTVFQTAARNHHRLSTSIGSSSSSDPDQSSSNEPFDTESVRKHLESLLGGVDKTPGSSVTETNQRKDNQILVDKILTSLASVILPLPPPLTSMDRDRRMAEIRALEELEDSDAATEVLWNLWFSERGLKPQALLQQADILMADPETWNECETQLRDLVDEHGIYFVEPVNRLATLYYLQNRFKESYALCKVILQVKPWHFGALSGIVLVCMGLRDRENARLWAERRLPSLVANSSAAPFAGGAQNPRRREWVQRAVEYANQSLNQAEQRTKSVLGHPEGYYTGDSPPPTTKDADHMADSDAWQ